MEKKPKVQPNTKAKIQEDRTKTTIAVITALPDELDFLLDMPFNWSEPKTLDGINYSEGHFLSDQTKIIATNAGGMGLVSMAIVTTKVLTAWRPSIAATIGICGGRKEKRLGLGDIVVANKCFHYQFGSIEDGKFARELVSENVHQEVLNIAENFKRTTVLNEIQNLPGRGFKKPNTVLQCHVGPMGSADLVVKDVEKLGSAVDADRKTIAVDMESYAFMHAAVKAKTPVSFVVKSVSDFADAEKDDEYRDYAKFTATEFFKRIAENLIT